MNSTAAKLVAGAVAAVCVALIPYTPDSFDVYLGGLAAVATALVNFFGGSNAQRS
jgi:hypothetical protein